MKLTDGGELSKELIWCKVSCRVPGARPADGSCYPQLLFLSISFPALSSLTGWLPFIST